MIGLAPVTMPANPKSPIKFLMPVADQIERMLSITGNSEFASNDGFLSDLKSSLCGQVSHLPPSLHDYFVLFVGSCQHLQPKE